MIKFSDYENFLPNITPEDMVKKGIFGKTYFRSIFCKLQNICIKNAHLEYEFTKNETSQIYLKNHNYYKVKCGTDYDFWIEKGWIKKQDPYGWFQWYCRFFHGRRSEDDKRQIYRWMRIAGPNGRFRKVLNKTNKIKQVLLHWGYFCEYETC